MPSYDLLRYYDLSDDLNASLSVGDDAGEKFGPTFEGLHVVAIGPPMYEGKDATVVLAHGRRPMPEVQELLDR